MNDPEKPADTVHTPNVQGVVPEQLVFQLDGEVAHHAGDDSDDHGSVGETYPAAG